MPQSLKNILNISKLLIISQDNSFDNKYNKIIKMFFKNITYISLDKSLVNKLEIIKPDVIICDISDEKQNILESVKQLRKSNFTTPILVISNLIDQRTLLSAIPLNLVDYLTKPVDINRLIYSLNKTAKLIMNNLDITVNITNELKYNFIDKKIINSKNEKTKLTKNEYKLLELLILNKDQTVSKEEILKQIWPNEPITDSAFKSLFLRLRNKIGKDRIQNSFGIGYSINLE